MRGKNFPLQKWKKVYPWLLSHAGGQCVTCSECSRANSRGLLSGEKRVDQAFISRGFRTWSKVPASFKQHEESSCHRTSLIQLKAADTPNPTEMQLVTGKAKATQEARVALDAIFDAVEYLALQALPLRSRDESCGNFHALLTTMAKKNAELRRWLLKGQQTFLSPQVQNEILEMMARKVLGDVAAEVREAEYFSVIVDESTDVTRQEQVSVSARFIDKNYEPQELFLGFYSTEDTSAATLATIILDTLQRLNLPLAKLRGQCYDGASNMSGRIGGVQALLKKQQPMAVFVHCAAHRLNLATLTAVIPKLRCALSEASALVDFIRGSPKRLAMFRQEQSEGSVGLRLFSRTRWTCNERSLQSLMDNWSAVQDTLAALEQDSATPTEPTAKARGFRRAMEDFEFFFLVRLGLRLY